MTVATSALARHSDANTALLATLDATLATVATLRAEGNASIQEWTQSAVALLEGTGEAAAAAAVKAGGAGSFQKAHAEAAAELKEDVAARVLEAGAALDAVAARHDALEVCSRCPALVCYSKDALPCPCLCF